MDIRFNVHLAKSLSVNEAIFLGWLEHNYDRKPIKTEALGQFFSFWEDETLYEVLVKLEERKLIRVQRDAQDYCLLSVDPRQFSLQTGIKHHVNTGTLSPVVLDNTLKKHLLRFQSSDTLLNKKLASLIGESSQELLAYAVSEGLSQELATLTFDKFLHYVSANPDRFWNQDLSSYWRFWVSNSKDKLGVSSGGNAGGGKRSAIERSNEHAASNWLQKKMSSPTSHTSIEITQKP